MFVVFLQYESNPIEFCLLQSLNLQSCLFILFQLPKKSLFWNQLSSVSSQILQSENWSRVRTKNHVKIHFIWFANQGYTGLQHTGWYGRIPYLYGSMVSHVRQGRCSCQIISETWKYQKHDNIRDMIISETADSVKNI